MNQLTVSLINGAEVVDSREVAEMVGKNHKDLLRDIRGYIEIMGNVNTDDSIERKIAPNEFFIPSEYKDSIGRTLPCYLLTKKGCDMVANKLTGEKGVLFTAAYVTAFEEMHERLMKTTIPLHDAAPAGIARLLDSFRRIAREAGSDPLAILETAVGVLNVYGIPTSGNLTKRITVQRSLWEDDQPCERS